MPQNQAGWRLQGTSARLLGFEFGPIYQLDGWADNFRKAVAAASGTIVERGQIPPDVVKQLKKGLAADKRKKPAGKKKKTG